MVEGEEVGDPAMAKPSAQAEVVVLRREIERAVAELHALRDAQAAQDAIARSRSLEAVGRLAGGIAHDFDNLLTSLVDSIDDARRASAGGASTDPHLERATAAARDASRIAKQLLAFAGQGLRQGEVVDLALETQRSLVILKRLVDAGVEMTVDTPSEPLWVYVERGHLTQILLHLVVNARDAMPGGGKLSIEVAPAVSAAPDGSLRPGARLRFTDTGVGIPAADLPRIFDPFFTTKLPGRGAGLGLSTVFGFVQGSGGDVDARSEEGLGTTFDLWFRAAPAPAMPVRRKSSPRFAAVGSGAAPADAVSPSSATEPKTILVVEDNASLAETCVAIFEGAGYRVLVASDGAAALEILERERHVATVLSDVVMPRLSGIELARKLAVSHPDLRVVLWSGYPQELSTEALVGGGHPGARSNVVSVLPKPVEADTLLRAVGIASARD